MSQTQVNGERQLSKSATSRGNSRVLYASRSFVDRLYAYKPSLRREEEEIQERIEARQRDRNLSKKLTKNWLDTQENIIKSSNEEKRRRKRLYDLEGKKILQEVETASQLERQKVLENAIRKSFLEQSHVKRLHSAFILTEVLNEQKAQLAFREKIKEMRREQEMKFVEKLNEDIRAYAHEIEKEKEDKIKSKLNYRKDLKMQLAEQERERVAEQLENKIITENFFEKLPRINTANADERKDKMQSLRLGLMEDFSQRETLRRERENDEKLDNQHIKIFHDAEEKIASALKEKAKQAFEKSQEVKSKVQNETASIFNRLERAREAEEKAIIDKRRIETKIREDNIAKANKSKYKHDIAEFLVQNGMILERKKKQMEELAETKRLLAQHRVKLSDRDKKYKELKDKERKYLQACTRAFYKAQNDAMEKSWRKEKRRDDKCFQEVILSHECEDDGFHEYAISMIEQCKSKGRDTRPMEKMLKEIYSTKLKKLL